jgi:hypothetical protein
LRVHAPCALDCSPESVQRLHLVTIRLGVLEIHEQPPAFIADE